MVLCKHLLCHWVEKLLLERFFDGSLEVYEARKKGNPSLEALLADEALVVSNILPPRG